MLACPRHLEALHRRAIAEELSSFYEHAFRNAIGAVGTASFRVRRRLDKSGALAGDPEITRSLDVIDKRVGTALFERRFLEQAGDPSPSRDVRSITDELVAELRLPSAVRLTVHVEQSGHTKGDPTELALALFCLIENASDALEGRGGHIEVHSAVRGDVVEIAVSDDGPGGAERMQPWSEPFFTTKAGRLGLGLSIVNRLIRRARGSFALSGTDAGGVRAVVGVPRASTATHEKSAPRVLLLDDDEASRISLGGLLEDIGVDVVEATTLSEARGVLHSGGFALALIDVYLRGEKGTDIIPELRAAQPQAKIIAVTGSTTGIAEGADLVLVKGSSPAAMLQEIAALLGEALPVRG